MSWIIFTFWWQYGLVNRALHDRERYLTCLSSRSSSEALWTHHLVQSEAWTQSPPSTLSQRESLQSIIIYNDETMFKLSLLTHIVYKVYNYTTIKQCLLINSLCRHIQRVYRVIGTMFSFNRWWNNVTSIEYRYMYGWLNSLLNNSLS